jgi:hypothetical protein
MYLFSLCSSLSFCLTGSEEGNGWYHSSRIETELFHLLLEETHTSTVHCDGPMVHLPRYDFLSDECCFVSSQAADGV